MPKYVPIAHPKFAWGHSNLIKLQWENGSLVADWFMPDNNENMLRVYFPEVEIIRLLDEMPISTEYEATPNEGLIPDNFAYLIEGATFWNYQSEALKVSMPRLKHYRFFTGWACLDVISNSEMVYRGGCGSAWMMNAHPLL